MQFSLKKKYSEYINNESINRYGKNERKLFGIREIETILLLSKYFLPQAKLINSYNQKKDKISLSLIDIGCGDRYLEMGCKEYKINYSGIDYNDCNYI